MKKILLTALLGNSLISFGQLKTNNFGLGISPFGSMNVKMEFKQSGNSDKMKINYNNLFNAHLFYERQLGGAGLLIEGSYATSTFKKVDNDIINLYNPRAMYSKKLSIYSGTVYGSTVINKQKRFQVPLYIGVGADYVSGNPVNMLFVSLAAKARMKFYITNHIALYGGYSYRTGLGLQSSDSSNNSEEKTTKLNLSNLDLGITFNL